MNYIFDPQSSQQMSRDSQTLSREGTRAPESDVINLDEVIAAARRQWKVAAISAAVFLVFGIMYLITAVPKYESTASILIDAGNQKIVDQLAELSGVLADEASILSQVELMRSEKIARAVSDNLNLQHSPEFMNQGSGAAQVLVFVKDLVTGRAFVEGTGESEERIQQGIVETLGRNLSVERVGRSYVLSLTYMSTDARLSAQVAKAFADAYLAEQLDSKYLATRRAGDWLQDRIATLRAKALETDTKVQKFKSEKNLISTGGQLVSEQQLTQVSSQLMISQSEALSAQSKLSGIEKIIADGKMDAAVSESIESPVVNKLRDQYLEASRNEADISSRLGKDHAQAIKLRREMSEYQRLMFEELSRIAQSYRSTAAVAESRVKTLNDQLARATSTSAAANDEQVQLRELQREADTYRNLYRTFLQRYQEAVQQESFPVTEARVISNPVPALKASSPRKGVALALSVMMGLMVGGAIGVLREWRDRFFRTGDQIRSNLNLEFIGNVPLTDRGVGKANPVDPTIAPDPKLVSKRRNSISSYVVDQPLSGFAETMRSAKIAVDLNIDRKKTKIVGFVSVYPGEGKSTVSINFAQLLANEGARVLLIDADLRNPGATRAIGRGAEKGIYEALTKNTPISDLIFRDPVTNLSFLPAVVTQRIPFSSELLASAAMDRIIADASVEYDYVIIDLPPLALLVDARAMSAKVDAFVMVVEWGKTPRAVVKRTLQTSTRILEKCVGVVLNKVDTAKLSLYEGFGSNEYYSKHYTKYFKETD